MTYSCTDFTDNILAALKIDVPEADSDNPSKQADLAMAEIERLQRAAEILKILQGDARADFQTDDEAWGKELYRLFGKNAGDVRYTNRGKGNPASALRMLYEARDASRIALDRAMGRAEDGSELEELKP